MRKNRIRTVFLTIAVIFTMSFAALPAYAASGTAITNADDLKAMENNPSGSYYLANDIEVPANLALFTDSRTPFTGTFDGNGHAIKNYLQHDDRRSHARRSVLPYQKCVI